MASETTGLDGADAPGTTCENVDGLAAGAASGTSAGGAALTRGGWGASLVALRFPNIRYARFFPLKREKRAPFCSTTDAVRPVTISASLRMPSAVGDLGCVCMIIWPLFADTP